MKENAGDASEEYSLSSSGGGIGTPPTGSGTSSGGSNDDQEMKHDDEQKDDDSNKNSEESGDKDPMDGQNGKDFTQKTSKGKEMTRMLVSFCHLSKSSTNITVAYFGMSTMDKPVDIQEEHWKDLYDLRRFLGKFLFIVNRNRK